MQLIKSVLICMKIKYFGNFNVLKLSLLGHNGAGKTTTINLITGMISKSKGKINSNCCV